MPQLTHKPKLMVQNISCILPEQTNLGALFLGNVYGAQNPAILKQYGIRAVLTSSIQTDLKFSFKDVPFHMKIEAHDKQNYNLKQHINKCIDFIEKARQLTNVYVHCFAGVSRSAAIVCAYIMWKLKWNYETTIAFVKAKRIVAKPNQGFVRQLMQIEQLILQQSSYASSKISEPQKSAYNSTFQDTSQENGTKIQPNLLKLPTNQKIIQQRSSSNVQHNFEIDNLPQNNAQHNLNFDHLTYISQANPAKKNTYLTDKLYKAKPFSNLPNQQPYQKAPPNVKKTQNNDRFLYLQNFFPQNHIIKNSEQNDPKTNINNYKLNNDLKPRSNLSRASTGQNLTNNLNDLQFQPLSIQGLKKVQSSHGSLAKNLANHHLQKPSSSSSQLSLGGKKPTYNHNSIPVPKVAERNQQPKKVFARVSESIPQSNFHYTQAQTTHHLHRASQGHELIPKVNQYMWTTPTQQKFNIQNILSNERARSPVNNSIYREKFDFRNSAPSQGFYNSKSTSQQKQAQKTTSRLLVRPKDLPGYKNY